MIRDLVDIGVNMVKSEKSHGLQSKAEQNTIERLLDLLIPPPPKKTAADPEDEPTIKAWGRTRDKFRKKLEAGELDDREVELDAAQQQFPVVEVFTPMGMEELGTSFQEMFSGLMPQKTKRRKMSVKEARRYLLGEELTKLVNMDEVIPEALERVQESGIIFVDEIDKIVGESSKTGPDVSRGGVQRDILPIVEGCSVNTKYGMVQTDHILFIAAGAFHAANPSDLIPELQGRFPIRVELDSLVATDLERILIEPQASLVKQYKALLKTEGVGLHFADAAIKKIAEYAERVNTESENIGARRLHTVMTTLLQEMLFEPPSDKKRVTITAKFVEKTLADIVESEDLSRYIL
jgi:ATP-dependent HslUV protease ATP-binding subunit HslU